MDPTLYQFFESKFVVNLPPKFHISRINYECELHTDTCNTLDDCETGLVCCNLGNETKQCVKPSGNVKLNKDFPDITCEMCGYSEKMRR